MGDRRARAFAWLGSLRARELRLQCESAVVQADLARARDALNRIAMRQPAPEFDVADGASSELFSPHGISIDVRLAEGWAAVAQSSTMMHGVFGVEQMIDQYRRLSALVRDARGPGAPCAIRIMVYGRPCEGYATGLVEAWDWSAPPTRTIDAGELCERLSARSLGS